MCPSVTHFASNLGATPLETGTRASRTRAILFLVIPMVLLLVLAASSASDTLADQSAPPAEWRAKTERPEAPPGEWSTARGTHVTEEQRVELDKLESLGYLAGGASAPSSSGVTIHDGSRSWQGLNLYVSGDFPGARLIDMDGNVVHESEVFLHEGVARSSEGVRDGQGSAQLVPCTPLREW